MEIPKLSVKDLSRVPEAKCLHLIQAPPTQAICSANKQDLLVCVNKVILFLMHKQLKTLQTTQAHVLKKCLLAGSPDM